jgi:hypothetical protein
MKISFFNKSIIATLLVATLLFLERGFLQNVITAYVSEPYNWVRHEPIINEHK